MKQETQSPIPEIEGAVVGERDTAICLYIEWLTMGISDTKKLIERIQKDGLARMSVGDFVPALENLGRECFVSWVEDIEGRCLATPKFANAYHKQHLCYACKVGELTRAIKERSPNNQQAQQLAAAIDRLYVEVSGAIDRGTTQYLTCNGKPQPADLLSDTRHGELWDSVENAIIELSTPRAETEIGEIIDKRANAVYDKRDAKSRKKDLFREEREWCEKWLKDEKKAGRKHTFGEAAEHFEERRAAAFKAHGTGYVSKASLAQGLNKFKHKLGIAAFQEKRGPHKQ